MPDPKKIKVYAGCEELQYKGYNWESGGKRVSMSRGDDLFEVTYSDIDEGISTQKHYCQGDTVYVDPTIGYIECGAKAKALHDRNCGATPTAETLLASEFVFDGEGDATVCGIKLNPPRSEEFIGLGSQCDSISKARDEMSKAYSELQTAQKKFTDLVRGLSSGDREGSKCNISRSAPNSDGTRIKFSYTIFGTDACDKANDAFKELVVEEEKFDEEHARIIRDFEPGDLEKGPDVTVETVKKYVILRKDWLEAIKYSNIKDFEDTIDALFKKKESGEENLETRYDQASAFILLYIGILKKIAKIPDDKLELLKEEVKIKFPEEETKSWPWLLKSYKMMKAAVDIYENSPEPSDK